MSSISPAVNCNPPTVNSVAFTTAGCFVGFCDGTAYSNTNIVCQENILYSEPPNFSPEFQAAVEAVLCPRPVANTGGVIDKKIFLDENDIKQIQNNYNISPSSKNIDDILSSFNKDLKLKTR